MTYSEFHSVPFTISTPRLLIRRLTFDDIPSIYRYACDEDVARFVTFEPHRSIDDSRAFVEKMISLYQTNQPSSYAIELKGSGEMIGTIGFARWDETSYMAELGYAIAKEFWGMGYTAEALRALIEHLFAHTELVRIEARAEPANTASIRVMQKAGMTCEGTLRNVVFIKGVHRTHTIYSILREECIPAKSQ